MATMCNNGSPKLTYCDFGKSKTFPLIFQQDL